MKKIVALLIFLPCYLLGQEMTQSQSIVVGSSWLKDSLGTIVTQPAGKSLLAPLILGGGSALNIAGHLRMSGTNLQYYDGSNYIAVPNALTGSDAGLTFLGGTGGIYPTTANTKLNWRSAAGDTTGTSLVNIWGNLFVEDTVKTSFIKAVSSLTILGNVIVPGLYTGGRMGLGISTGSSTYAMEIKTSSGDGAGLLVTDTTSTGSVSLALGRNGGEANVLRFQRWNSAATGTLYGLNKADLGVLSQSVVGALAIATIAAQPIVFATNNTLALTIGTDQTATFAASVTGNHAIRDTASFTTTDIRTAIYISGATATNFYVATPRIMNSETQPSANDILACWAKTDSLIVTRPASGTSGLKFTYIRMK